jgi:hypothetical protein
MSCKNILQFFSKNTMTVLSLVLISLALFSIHKTQQQRLQRAALLTKDLQDYFASCDNANCVAGGLPQVYELWKMEPKNTAGFRWLVYATQLFDLQQDPAINQTRFTFYPALLRTGLKERRTTELFLYSAIAKLRFETNPAMRSSLIKMMRQGLTVTEAFQAKSATLEKSNYGITQYINGRLSLFLKNPGSAIEQLKDATNRFPNNKTYALWLARAYAANNQPELSRTVADQALKIAPTGIRSNLNEIYDRTIDKELALVAHW